jgi:hypothetical protein
MPTHGSGGVEESPRRRPRIGLFGHRAVQFLRSTPPVDRTVAATPLSAGSPRAVAAATPAPFFPLRSTASTSAARPDSALAPVTGSSPACACAPASTFAGKEWRGRYISCRVTCHVEQRLWIPPASLVMESTIETKAASILQFVGGLREACR